MRLARTINVPLIAVGICGLVAATQARINASLGERIGSSLIAALVSFGVGFLLLFVSVTVRASARAKLRKLRHTGVRWELFSAGLIGATFVTTSVYATQQVGVAVFIVVAVTGQVVGGLIVDQTSLSAAGKKPITAVRVAGAALASVGAAITQLGNPLGDLRLLPILAVFAVSTLLPLQVAMNARIGRACGSSQVAALVSFAVGTTGLVALSIPVVMSGSGSLNAFPTEPWLYLGGLFGAIFITGLAWAGSSIDVLRLSLLFIGGQLVGGLTADAFIPDGPGISVFVVLGASITLAAVGVAGRGDRRNPNAAKGCSNEHVSHHQPLPTPSRYP